jgi:hypothetical protein
VEILSHRNLSHLIGSGVLFQSRAVTALAAAAAGF